ncbi:MAG: VTT domain-containing protein [Desulfuromusa sp.]|jgi:membrane protein DedA with SNARE-associated domain/membrane-associated phospholipid phosphatase|nr:VTT domain-containing protein [Desulfuromusa sp.]
MDWTYFWNHILQWVTLHPITAYLAIFLIALSESLAIVGLLVPGTVMMVGIGALAGIGAISLKITLLAALFGAIAGDGISYWLGYHYHQRIREFWPFRNHPRLLSHGEEFFHRHGGKSVFLGRFVGPVRPIIPVIAGMLDMSPKHFVFVNVLSAIGWAFAYIIPGVILGSSLTLIGVVSTRLSLLLLLLLLLLWLTFWLSKKVFVVLSRLGPKSERLLLPLLCLSLVVAGWVFLGVLEDVLTMDPLVRADQSIYQFLQSLRTTWVDQLMVAVTEMGDAVMNIFTAATILLILLFKRNFRAAIYWLLAVSGGALLVELFKWLLHRPRPIDIYQGISSWGFPSGHTTMSVVLFGFLAILLVRSFPPRWSWIPFAVAIGTSLLIAFSRLYLGVHWLSDVLGGFSLGWAWATLLGIFYLRKPTGPQPTKLLLISLTVVYLLVGAWHIQQRHRQDMSRYLVQHQVQRFSFSDWQTKSWQQLPAWRIDFGGEMEQPLTLQWAGNPEILATKLRQQGWVDAAGIDYKQLLNFFVPDVSVQQLPLLPQLTSGQHEQLRMALDQGEQRLVLRLWPTRFQLDKSAAPLWVGSVETEQAIATAGLLTLPRGRRNFTAALQQLEQRLVADLRVAEVRRSQQESEDSPGWTGRIILIWDASELSVKEH